MATWGIIDLDIGNAYGEYTYAQDTQNNVTILNTYTKFRSKGTGAGYLDATGRIQIGGNFYSGNASINLERAATSTLVSKTYTIYHNTDGSVPTGVGLQFSFSADGVTQYSQHKFLSDLIPKIARQSLLEVSDFVVDIEEGESNEIPIEITDYVSFYTKILTISILGNTIKRIENPETGNIRFTDDEIQHIYSLMKETSENFVFTLETYDNETLIGANIATVKGTLSSIDLKPTFNNFVYSDDNPTTYNLTGNRYTLIKGHSNPRITVAGSNIAVAHKGATISKYTFINGEQTKDYIMGEYPAYVDLIGVTNNVMSVWAIDSRGESTKVDKIATNWIDYKNIEKTTFTAEREDGNTSTLVTLKLQGKVFDGSFGEVENNIKSAFYKYKKTGDEEWIEGTTELNVEKEGDNYFLEQLIAGDLGANGFDQEESYDIYVEVSDQLSTIKDEFILGAGSPAIAILGNKIALGAPYNETLGGRVQIPQVTGVTNFETNILKQGQEVANLDDVKKSVITVGFYGSNSQELATYLTKAHLNTVINQSGDASKLSLDGTNYAVRIGAGVSKILVSAFAVVNSNVGVTETANFNITTMKNDFKLTNDYVTRPSGIGGYFIGESLSPVLVDVEEGDLITLQLLGTQPTSNLIANTDTANNNYLTVEVIE